MQEIINSSLIHFSSPLPPLVRSACVPWVVCRVFLSSMLPVPSSFPFHLLWSGFVRSSPHYSLPSGGDGVNEEGEAETSERHPTKGRGVKAKMTRPNGRRHNRLACQSHVPSFSHLPLTSPSRYAPVSRSFFPRSLRVPLGEVEEVTR